MLNSFKEAQQNPNLIKLSDLLKLVPLSRTDIYDRLNPKSRYYDSTFPRPIKLGERTNRWVREEVEEWLEALKAQRFNSRMKGAKNEC